IASFRNYDSYNLAFGISKNYFMLNFIHFFDMVLCLHDSILYFFFDVFAFKTYEVKNIQEIHSVLAGIGQFMNDFFFFFFFLIIIIIFYLYFFFIFFFFFFFFFFFLFFFFFFFFL